MKSVNNQETFKKKDPRNFMDAREQYGLSHKQWKFCILYCGEAECSPSRAAAWSYGNADGLVSEGGSMEQMMAGSVGSQNMKKPAIQACIQDLMGISVMTSNEVMHRISKMASANLSELLDIGDDGKAIVNLKKAQQRGAMYLIKKLNFDSFGNLKSMELHDSFAALTKLGQHHKLFDRTREVTVDSRDLARELLDDLRAKHEDIPDSMLVQKVLERFSGSGVTESDLIEQAPDLNN